MRFYWELQIVANLNKNDEALELAEKWLEWQAGKTFRRPDNVDYPRPKEKTEFHVFEAFVDKLEVLSWVRLYERANIFFGRTYNNLPKRYKVVY